MISVPAPVRFSLLAIVFVVYQPALGQEVEFNRHIRPILSDRCFQCHGPDDKKRDSDLRFDIESDAKKDLGGYHAIVDGNVDESTIFERVLSEDPDQRMPPPGSGKSLSDDEIQLLRKWVESGAEFQQHWAFQKPSHVSRPNRAEKNGIATGEIDRIVFAKLRENGFQPSPEADRSTLIRRLTLDLTGLSPTIDEVNAFVNDQSDSAYERLVDRLLASKHFGERMGRHWLDLARYADSNGYANDGLRSIWPYRDWVINALNEDMPFDQFTREQLAGDLLPNPSESQLVATGFHRNTPLQTEGGSDAEQYRVERTKNRVDTTGAIWLGLTIGCAQCHSHKFDPITHKEYYQLYAFFNSCEEPTHSLADADTQAKIAELRFNAAEIDAQIAAELKRISAAKQSVHNFTEANGDTDNNTPEWRTLRFDEIESKGGAKLTMLPDLSILASGKNPAIDTYRLAAKLPVPARAIRIETLTHNTLPKGGPGRAGNGNFVLAEITILSQGKAIEIVSGLADHSQSGYDVTDAFDGQPQSGWAINVKKGMGSLNVNRTAVFAFEHTIDSDVAINIRTYEKGNGYNIGRFRISVSTKTPAEMPVQVANAKLSNLETAKASIEKKIHAIERSRPKTLIMREREQPRKSFVQIRGDFLDPGPTVRPATLAVLHPLRTPIHKSERDSNRELSPSRLDLANWLMSQENPLTPRVHVNRIWQHLFGTGLVETENDFGYQGSLPSHPRLLDFLANDLIAGGWKQKRIYKAIVMSATYRQSSTHRKTLYSADPKNRWLGRQNRFRVEGEVVRDVALTASGLLSPKMGGPSVFPPIPPNVIGTSSAKHRWPESKGEDRFRRGLYTAIYRANVYPMLLAFDGPDRDNACTRRGRSNTPLQALTIANDTAFVEMAVAFGKRIAKQTTIKDKIRFAFLAAFSREPTGAESKRISEFQASRLEFYKSHLDQTTALTGQKSAELASWCAVARVLMNLDEFITRE